MRILAMSWGVSDRRGGGEPAAAIETIRALAREGIEIDVVAPFIDAETPLPENVHAYEVKGGPRMGNTGANKLAMLRGARSVARAHPPDVIHVVSQFTSFPVFSHPFVISGCWVFPPRENEPRPRSHFAAFATELARLRGAERADKIRDITYALTHERIRGWTLERTLATCDAVIVQTALGLPEFSRFRNAVHIPIGVDTETFQPTGEDEGFALFAGNLRDYKGIDLLLAAFAVARKEAPDARLHIVGRGPERGALERLAHDLGVADHVVFRGFLSRAEVVREIQRCAFYTLAGRGEAYAVTNVEALACGKPVLSTDRASGAFDYIRQGVNGFIEDPFDANAFGRRMAHLFGDPDLRRRMGAAARATAETLTWRVIARRHLELYERLIESRKPSWGQPPV